MSNYSDFKEEIKRAAEQFKTIPKTETIRIISHLDADGIAAASILIKAIQRDNRKYLVSIVHQLNRKVIDKLKNENYTYYVFTDLGSGQLENLKELNKKIIILDHHKPTKAEAEHIIHINPHLFGIDGSKEISGAGVVYFFASAIGKQNQDMAHIAIVGATGDNQEDNGFLELNNEILETAKKLNLIQVKKGLRLFGIQTKPLHRVLQYSTDPYIPGVSGSESGAIQFLSDIGIIPNGERSFRKLIHLSGQEMEKLISGIIMKRVDEEKPDDVLGNVYTLINEKEGFSFRDTKEFSTLLNSTGRLNRASLGIAVCLGNEKAKSKANALLTEYKREIVNAMNWFKDNSDEEFVTKGKNFVIINTQDNILPTMVGTLASILSKGNDFDNGTFILSLGQLGDGYTKISLRMAGKVEDMDLKSVVKKITEDLEEAETGGHNYAAGAMIKTDDEAIFINKAKEIFSNWKN